MHQIAAFASLVIHILFLVAGEEKKKTPQNSNQMFLLGILLSLWFGNWLLDAFCLVVLVILDESFDRAAIISNKPLLVSRVLSLQKILLFHIQATILLNGEFWRSWLARWVFFGLQFVNLNLRGFFACNSVFSANSNNVTSELLLVLLTPMVLFFFFMLLAWVQTMLEDVTRAKKDKDQRLRDQGSKRNESSEDEEAALINSGEDEPLHDAPKFQDRLLNLLLRIIYTAYFELCVVILGSLKCTPDMVSGELFMFFFPWLACENRPWKIAVPFFVIYCIGVPIVFAILLLRPKSKRARYYLSFVFENFKRNRSWYELCALLEKLFLASCLTLPDELMKSGILTVLFVFVVLRLILKPYKDKAESLINLVSSLLLALTQSQIGETVTFQISLALTVIVTFFNSFFVFSISFYLIWTMVQVLKK